MGFLFYLMHQRIFRFCCELSSFPYVFFQNFNLRWYSPFYNAFCWKREGYIETFLSDVKLFKRALNKSGSSLIMDGGWFDLLCMFVISLSMLENGQYVAHWKDLVWHVNSQQLSNYKWWQLLTRIFKRNLNVFSQFDFYVYFSKQLTHLPYLSQWLFQTFLTIHKTKTHQLIHIPATRI